MRFTKMHGLGNDYLFFDGFVDASIARRTDWSGLTRAICDRHRGVGADGVIVLSPAEPGSGVDARLRIYNADGLDGGVCGNGTRCAAKMLADRGHVAPRGDQPIVFDAGARRLRAFVRANRHGLVDAATVDMGPAVFDLPRIPVEASLLRLVEAPADGRPGLYKIDHRTACFVSVGNPHMIAFVEEPVEMIALADEGPKFERHPAFPLRMNYHLVNIKDRGHVVMRPWERGTGLTQACASGACAVAAAGAALGHLDRHVRVEMPGGALAVQVDAASGSILMTGEAVEVYSGEWNE